MPGSFDITTTKDAIVLDPAGRGEVVFIVTNRLGRPVRAWAKVVPLEAAKQGWFSILGETERDFAAQGTHQYTVQVFAAGAAVGQYSFRLYINSVANAEEFEEGPTVIVQMPAATPPHKEFPWGLIVAAVLILVLAGVGWWYWSHRSRAPAVPDVEVHFDATRVDGKKLVDPYVESRITFTGADKNAPVGLVQNKLALVCVPPPDANQVLGTGVPGSVAGQPLPPADVERSIGLGNYPIRADLSEELPAGTQVSVDFQSIANWEFRVQLYDARNNLAGVSIGKIPTGSGSCKEPEFGERGRTRVTAIATTPFKYVLMTGVTNPGFRDSVSFVIDNFTIDR